QPIRYIHSRYLSLSHAAASLSSTMLRTLVFLSLFFFNAPATTEIYTLSLHDALPISPAPRRSRTADRACAPSASRSCSWTPRWRSEEHTSELQSRFDLVCRLLLEKKKKKKKTYQRSTDRHSTQVVST